MTTESAAPTAEDQKRGPILRDPLLGLEVPMYLGGDGVDVELPEGDRGDGLEPAAPVEASKPEVTEPEVTEPEATEPPPNPVQRERDPETGRFLKTDGQETESQETESQETRSEEPMIPKARLDKEIGKRKLLERKLQEAESRDKAVEQATEQAYDFDTAEKAYMDLLLDGKLDEAAAKRREIRAAERAEFEALSSQVATATNARQTAVEQIDTISSQYEKDFPAFDPEAEEYDATAVAQAQAVYKGYIDLQIYDNPIEAFKAALDTVVKAQGWNAPAAAVSKPPQKPAAPARTAQKRVEAIASQPPVTTSAGTSGTSHGATAIDLSTLTDDQLLKLPAATLARLRGDEL